MTRRELVQIACHKRGFRAPRAAEPTSAYREALANHVQQEDFAAGHEIRLGKPQAEWTKDEVKSFMDHVLAMGPARETLRPGVFAMPVVTDEGPYPATDAEVLRQANAAVAALVAMRRARPTDATPIFASVLLTTGQTLSTIVRDRGDRIGIVKWLAQSTPVVGFWLVFDAFAHTVDTANGVATKRDAIMAQVGSRDMRVMKLRTYTVVDGVAVFDDPPPDDILMHGPGAGAWRGHDPYASVFVSVPESDRVQ